MNNGQLQVRHIRFPLPGSLRRLRACQAAQLLATTAAPRGPLMWRRPPARRAPGGARCRAWRSSPSIRWTECQRRTGARNLTHTAEDGRRRIGQRRCRRVNDGRPNRSSATISPSSTTSRPRPARTSASSGNVDDASAPLRVKTLTVEPAARSSTISSPRKAPSRTPGGAPERSEPEQHPNPRRTHPKGGIT